MMKRTVTACLLFSVAALTSNVAAAQGASCAKREMIVERLSHKYGETRQSAGLNQNNGMVEVFAWEESGTWTILVTMPNGISCLMAAGNAWEGLAATDTAQGKGV